MSIGSITVLHWQHRVSSFTKQSESVKETYGRGAECTEDGRDERIRATEYTEGNRTRKRGGKAERIMQG